MADRLEITPDAQGRFVALRDDESALDWYWDWGPWLDADGDTIITAAVTGEECVIDSFAHDGRIVVAWVSGGEAGVRARAVCHVITQQGREDDRSIIFKVKER